MLYMDWISFVIPLFRDNTRTIISLPVSPSSSPLRRYGPTHQSCYFSPPHPAYTVMGQSSYTLNDACSYPIRSNATLTLDPWNETSRFKANTPPGGSPRMRLIWVEIVNSYRTKICLPSGLWMNLVVDSEAQTIQKILVHSLYMKTRWQKKMILALSSGCIGLGWGDSAACNNFLIIVNPMSYCICSNFMLYNASSWQNKKNNKKSNFYSHSFHVWNRHSV